MFDDQIILPAEPPLENTPVNPLIAVEEPVQETETPQTPQDRNFAMMRKINEEQRRQIEELKAMRYQAPAPQYQPNYQEQQQYQQQANYRQPQQPQSYGIREDEEITPALLNTALGTLAQELRDTKQR